MLFAPRIVIIIIQHETNEMHICQINNLIFLSVLHVSKPGGGGLNLQEDGWTNS